MGLLSENSLKDHLHYGIALVFAVVSGVMGLMAAHQLRMLILTWVAYAGYDRLGRRFANIVAWVILGIIWAMFFMVIENYYREGVTLARAQKLRAEDNLPVPPPPENAVMRFLWQHDLHIVFRRFAKIFVIPMAVYVVAYIIMTLMVRAMVS